MTSYSEKSIKYPASSPVAYPYREVVLISTLWDGMSSTPCFSYCEWWRRRRVWTGVACIIFIPIPLFETWLFGFIGFSWKMVKSLNVFLPQLKHSNLLANKTVLRSEAFKNDRSGKCHSLWIGLRSSKKKLQMPLCFLILSPSAMENTEFLLYG